MHFAQPRALQKCNSLCFNLDVEVNQGLRYAPPFCPPDWDGSALLRARHALRHGR